MGNLKASRGSWEWRALKSNGFLDLRAKQKLEAVPKEKAKERNLLQGSGEEQKERSDQLLVNSHQDKGSS